jgi:hypothetical protein
MAVLALSATLAGCASSRAEQAFELSPRSLKERQIESRRFDGTDSARLLVACQALLQDMGFHTDESESRLGLLVASADRSAVSAGQVASSILMSVTPLVSSLQALWGRKPMTWDENQRVRASLIVTESTPAGAGTFVVRVTFQRIVWDNHQKLSHQEWLGEPELYQDFFSRLSRSVFLEAHEL